MIVCSSLSHLKHKANFVHSLQPGLILDTGTEHFKLLLQANTLHFKQTYLLIFSQPTEFLSAIFKPFQQGNLAFSSQRYKKLSGFVVNYNIAIDIGERIVLAKDQTLLKQNGGSLNLDFLLCNHFFKEL